MTPAISLEFDRPRTLEATLTPEERGIGRDGVRLLVTDPSGSTHSTFRDLPALLRPGDLLVVNESATLPASLPATREDGPPFRLNLSTDYGDGVWLAEPRWGPDRPGPIALRAGEAVVAGGETLRAIGPYPSVDRLWFFQARGSLARAMERFGAPIRYGYLDHSYPLEAYQTVFGSVPGSSEMPSAGRPFTDRLLRELARREVGVARLWLHTGVSSLEADPGPHPVPPVYPEPFEVGPATAERVNATREAGGRVIAVGTTVVRALETSCDGRRVRPGRGFSRRVLEASDRIRSIDGLITGLHDARTSHLALLIAFAGEDRVRESYRQAVTHGYLWHEFGDSHLIWTGS